MPYSLIVDGVVAVLLVVTIGYAMTLNKRLGLLRRDRGELEKLANTFMVSTERANESLGQLHATAEVLQRQIESAHGLHDDLAFLVERGEKAADRLEETIRLSREFLNPDSEPSEPTLAEPSKTPTFYETKDEAQVNDRLNERLNDRLSEDTNVADPNTIPTGQSDLAPATEPAPAPAPRVLVGEQPSKDQEYSPTDAERDLLKAIRSAN